MADVEAAFDSHVDALDAWVKKEFRDSGVGAALSILARAVGALHDHTGKTPVDVPEAFSVPEKPAPEKEADDPNAPTNIATDPNAPRQLPPPPPSNLGPVF